MWGYMYGCLSAAGAPLERRCSAAGAPLEQQIQ